VLFLVEESIVRALRDVLERHAVGVIRGEFSTAERISERRKMQV
jgi:hypothetical protein